MESNGCSATEKVLSMPDFIHPELLDDELFSFFTRAGGVPCHEEIDDLRKIADRLEKLSDILHDILYEHGPGMPQLIFSSLNRRKGKANIGWYALEPETLTVNEVLYLLIYPFCARMGGSWEARFALSGMLTRYLFVYREKCAASVKSRDGGKA